MKETLTTIENFADFEGKNPQILINLHQYWIKAPMYTCTHLLSYMKQNGVGTPMALGGIWPQGPKT